MSATLESQVAAEQAAHDAAGHEDSGDETDAPDPDGKALFDPAVFDSEELALPKVDGQGITKIQAKFGGGPWLDRALASDVALVRDIKVRERVTLLVDAIAGPPIPGYTTNREGDLDVLSLSRKFTVEAVNVAAANLGSEQQLIVAARRLANAGFPADEILELVTNALETSGGE